jgi:hypothetical protein
MNERPPRTGVTIFAGRFGSGKTEAAINYALALAQGWALADGRWKSSVLPTSNRPSPILIDLDIVTPYFRTRETGEAMAERGVIVIAPSVVGQHLDVPAITPQILGAIEQMERPIVLDAGGDPQGARALGQFSAAIRHRGYTMHFVVNPYRPFTGTLEGLAHSITEIEASARLQVTSLVSNPNLIQETTKRQIVEGHARIESFARELGLPVAFVCVERRWAADLADNHFAQPVLVLDRFFVMPWESEMGDERRENRKGLLCQPSLPIPSCERKENGDSELCSTD